MPQTNNWEEILVYQHTQIEKLLEALHKECITILNTKKVDVEWFEKCLYFISNYADKEHHDVEEHAIFEKMKVTSEQGRILVENGMLVEHQMARFYVKQMKKLIQGTMNDDAMVRLIGFAQSYVDLLSRHIDKENNVAYPYARKNIDEKELNDIFFEFYKPSTLEKELHEFLNV